MYHVLKAAKMHTRENIVLASDLYIAGCITRDPEEVGRVFDAMTTNQRNLVLTHTNQMLEGKVGKYKVKSVLDRGLSPRIDGYILKTFDWIYRAIAVKFLVKMLARAFASGGHGHSAASSSSGAGGAGGGAGGGGGAPPELPGGPGG